jgi:histidine ammonia-lyase
MHEDIVTNAELVVAMEAMAATQALDLRSPLESAEGTRAAHDALRDVVPFLEVDRELRPDIDACVELVRGGGLVAAVESVVGRLD